MVYNPFLDHLDSRYTFNDCFLKVLSYEGSPPPDWLVCRLRQHIQIPCQLRASESDMQCLESSWRFQTHSDKCLPMKELQLTFDAIMLSYVERTGSTKEEFIALYKLTYTTTTNSKGPLPPWVTTWSSICFFPGLLDLDIAPARPRVPFTLPEEETTLMAANNEQEETNPLLTEEESLARLLRKMECKMSWKHFLQRCRKGQYTSNPSRCQ